MASDKATIGLFGGSFDPPHLGHEALVRAAIEQLELDEVWVIPAGSPVHRTLSGCADARLRLKWLEEIFSDTDDVRVVDWEVDQSKPVPAVTTLRQFKAQNPDVTPIWLSGADAFEGMSSWVDYPAHLKLCSVAVFDRSKRSALIDGVDWKQVSLSGWLQNEVDDPGYYICIDAVLPDVSATEIRDRAEIGESLKGLVNSRISEEVESRYRSGAGDKH